MAKRLIIKLAKSVSICAESVAIARLPANTPPEKIKTKLLLFNDSLLLCCRRDESERDCRIVSRQTLLLFDAVLYFMSDLIHKYYASRGKRNNPDRLS